MCQMQLEEVNAKLSQTQSALTQSQALYAKSQKMLEDFSELEELKKTHAITRASSARHSLP